MLRYRKKKYFNLYQKVLMYFPNFIYLVQQKKGPFCTYLEFWKKNYMTIENTVLPK